MRTSSVAAVLALLSLAPMAAAQVAAPDYVFLDTEKTSTLQRELQAAADNGYRLVSGYGSWGRPTVILEKVLEPEPIEYLLLATAKTGTLQDEIAEAATQGYRLTSVFEKGGEAVVVMQRAPGQADPTHEYVVLGTKRLDTMEEEFRAAAANDFKLVGHDGFARLAGEPEANHWIGGIRHRLFSLIPRRHGCDRVGTSPRRGPLVDAGAGKQKRRDDHRQSPVNRRASRRHL